MTELTSATHGHKLTPCNDFEAARVRAEKMARIRASIKARSYHIPAEQVADKMIEHRHTWQVENSSGLLVS